MPKRQLTDDEVAAARWPRWREANRFSFVAMMVFLLGMLVVAVARPALLSLGFAGFVSQTILGLAGLGILCGGVFCVSAYVLVGRKYSGRRRAPGIRSTMSARRRSTGIVVGLVALISNGYVFFANRQWTLGVVLIDIVLLLLLAVVSRAVSGGRAPRS